MPPQKKKSGLVAAMGDKIAKAHEAHKDDEVKLPGGGSLPDGIENGIARLIDCRFSQYKEGENKGKYFFYAAGSVVEPKVVEVIDAKGKLTSTIPVEGQHTRIMEPLCDTPKAGKRKTVEDHYAHILNYFRLLGIDTKEVSYDEIEDIAASLKEAGPYFRFRTWKGDPTPEYPKPRVNETWGEACEYNAEVTDDVVDQSAGTPDEQPGDEAPAEEPAAEEAPAVDTDDLEALGAAADGGDIEAQKKLQGSAKLLGIDYEAAETWVALAAEIAEKDGEAPAAEAEVNGEAGDDWSGPVKAEVYKYKTSRMKKPIEVEVTAVFEGKQTVNLKSLDDGKTTFKSIAWADLIKD